MNDRDVTEVEILTNEIRRLTIERDRYHAAVKQGRDLLLPVVGPAIHEGMDEVETAWLELEEAARFHQQACPRCGTPCELTVSMYDGFGREAPDYQAWDCPGCGKIGGPLTPASLEELQALSAFRDAVLARAKGEPAR